ncbi:SMP-30/gluconolactonase/LRE family protein [Plantactinospora sonchi]|uniref:SMP-30/gluconolactonase/LRE family protein n=1 Tax=Plantactinospora sonchi TaxID=1544735 RepID=A0ABU7S3J0_9ACTN
MARPRIDPVVWQPDRAPHRARQGSGGRPMPPVRLRTLSGQGPEDVAVDSRGRVYTGLADGRIVLVTDDHTETVAETGGRPLGVEVQRDGRLVVCDAVRGLLRVDPITGRLETLVAAGTPVDGAPLRLCNNAAVATDGTIFFSDSSQRFTLAHWKADLLEHSGTGRLLRRDPDGRTGVVRDGLHFANGVALAADESFVVVAETGAYRLIRIWLAGPRAGGVDRLADNLPGFPDNLSRGTDGLLWIALGSPRNTLLDLLSPRHPALRRAVWALPERLQPKPADTAWVQALDVDGRLVHDLQTRVPGFSMVTGVREHRGRVWLGSLHGTAVATFDVPAAD